MLWLTRTVEGLIGRLQWRLRSHDFERRGGERVRAGVLSGGDRM